MRQNLVLLAVVVSWSLSLSMALAADLVRQPIDQGTVQKNYTDVRIEGGSGLDMGVAVNSVDWKEGSRSYSAQSGSPDVSIYYGVTESYDIRSTLKYMSVKDGDSETRSELSVVRLGFGGRLWWSLKNNFYPYVGPMLNYYFMDDEVNGSADGAVGISVDAGIAYLLENSVMFRIGAGYEGTLLDGEISIDGKREDLSLSAANLGVGVVVLF